MVLMSLLGYRSMSPALYFVHAVLIHIVEGCRLRMILAAPTREVLENLKTGGSLSDYISCHERFLRAYGCFDSAC